MNIKGIIDNWIISNICIYGTVRGTNEQIVAPYSKWTKHPSMGTKGSSLIAVPFTTGTTVGLMDMGMWTLGVPMITDVPIIDHWVMSGNINPACYKAGNCSIAIAVPLHGPYDVKNIPMGKPVEYEVKKASGTVQGQYRDTKIEFVGHVNPLFDAPWGDELGDGYTINVEDIGPVILGKRMSWHGVTLTHDEQPGTIAIPN